MARQWTRRQILTGATLLAATGAAGVNSLANVTLGNEEHQNANGDTIVAIFLRGGADGLHFVVPYVEDDYYRLRPTLALARPNDKTTDKAGRVLDLDGFFGMHPALAPLHNLFHEGMCAVVHAVGSGDQTRSHFEAMATMERGLAQDAGTASGWLGRHLNLTADALESPLRAVAIGDTLPDALRGATTSVSLRALSDFRLKPPTDAQGRDFHAGNRADALTKTLHALYEEPKTPRPPSSPDPYQLPMPIERAGKETLNAIDAVRRLDPANYRPSVGISYPNNELADGLKQVACLLKGNVGLEIACLELGGWDTHITQGRDGGLLPGRLSDLGQALGAFVADLNKRMNRTTILVMTEFGRRAYENYSLGTDHGRASCMLLLGGGVVGGKVHADWPTLAKDKLESPGDLRVTTDYRDILAEVLLKRAKNPRAAEVFPEYRPRYRNVFREA